MILIDKAKLMNHIKDFLGIKSPSTVFLKKFDIEGYDVENASTVEAIPTEWIEEWLKKMPKHTTPYFYKRFLKNAIRGMVEDWRKENE